MSRITVAGAGAFGTALAVTLARAGHDVTLWARNADLAAAIVKAGENHGRLPGVELPGNLCVTAETACLSGADAVLLAVPMQALVGFLDSYAGLLGCVPLVACCKGVSLHTGTGPTGIMAMYCPDSPAAILTGPSFAADIARRLPTALTLACRDAVVGEMLQRMLSTPTLRLYRTTDTMGAELGGALKNVIAIAAGIVIGAGLGDSARAALMTRGFAEMRRFADATGARPETLSGLSGLGDLVLTCTSEQSRNFRHGRALGRGEALDEGVTVEGVATAQAVARLAKERGIDTPIIAMVAQVVTGNLAVSAAVEALMARPLKEE